MAEHYYTVGKHGPPTKETAPHGVRYLPCGEGDVWCLTATSNPGLKDPLTRWAPLPAPPTEEAPAPEPVARWTHDRGWIKYVGTPIPEADVAAAVDALNTLDRDGVAWGEPRPPEALPETGRVLVAFTNGHVGTWNTWDLGDRRLNVTGWWPLPEVTP